MKSILHLISPRSAEKKKEKDTDENDSYSDDDFEDGDEDFSSPVKTSRTENTEKGSILTTSVTPVTKEAGDDALNDFLNGLSSSSSSDEEEVESKTLPVKVLDKKKVEKQESPSPNIKKNPLPSMKVNESSVQNKTTTKKLCSSSKKINVVTSPKLKSSRNHRRALPSCVPQ